MPLIKDLCLSAVSSLASPAEQVLICSLHPAAPMSPHCRPKAVVLEDS